MGAKFQISEAVGDELVKRFGKKLRLISEKDFQLMSGFMEGIGIKRVVDSERIEIRGGVCRRKGKR